MHESPSALKRYLPRARYLLIDEKHQVIDRKDGDDNLVTALFRLEHSRTKDEVRRALDVLIARLPQDDQSGLRNAFSAWVEATIMPRVQGSPESEFHDIKEIRSMLSETIQRWKMEYRRNGLRAGRKQGLRQGLEKGLAEARKAGRREGRRVGRREGEAQLLQRLLQKRFGELPDSVHARLARATLAQLEAWAERMLDAPSIEALMKARNG